MNARSESKLKGWQAAENLQIEAEKACGLLRLLAGLRDSEMSYAAAAGSPVWDLVADVESNLAVALHDVIAAEEAEAEAAEAVRPLKRRAAP